MLSVQKFECTNCGGIDWVTIGALVIAAVALGISIREHRRFMKQANARARFRLKMRALPNADEEGVLRTHGSSMWPRVEIGIKNYGDRAAGPTLINVVAPRHLEYFQWSASDGADIEDTSIRPVDTDEILVDDDGREWPAKFLALELPRVAMRPDYVKFVHFAIDVPSGGKVSIPLRVTIEADEMPDDVRQVAERFMLRIVHTHAA
jgi:hypothetical protein